MSFFFSWDKLLCPLNGGVPKDSHSTIASYHVSDKSHSFSAFPKHRRDRLEWLDRVSERLSKKEVTWSQWHTLTLQRCAYSLLESMIQFHYWLSVSLFNNENKIHLQFVVKEKGWNFRTELFQSAGVTFHGKTFFRPH